MYYKLIREYREGKAVLGCLYRTSHYFNNRTGEYVERLYPICETMENADYLIPALIYRVTVTRSRTCQRLLPVLANVPDRTGIRICRGTQPEQSRGCILVNAAMEQELTARFLAEQSVREETRLEITFNL